LAGVAVIAVREKYWSAKPSKQGVVKYKMI
jgi:hypothetical protein